MFRSQSRDNANFQQEFFSKNNNFPDHVMMGSYCKSIVYSDMMKKTCNLNTVTQQQLFPQSFTYDFTVLCVNGMNSITVPHSMPHNH